MRQPYKTPLQRLTVAIATIATAVFTGFIAVLRKVPLQPKQRLTTAIAEPLQSHCVTVAEPLRNRCSSHCKAVAVAIENQNTNLIHTVNQHFKIFPLQWSHCNGCS